MTTDVHPSPLSALDARTDYYGTLNIAQATYCSDPGLFSQTNLGMFVIIIFTLLICLFGVVGNGTVIWLLGLPITRNPFTIYIKHLSIADLGLLTAVAASKIFWVVAKSHSSFLCVFLFELFEDLFLFLYTAVQCLLTVISIDRCVSVFFPFWYRYHRPRKLTTTICILTWVFSFMLPGTQFSVTLFHYKEGFSNLSYYPVNSQRVINALVCLPLMAISTLILFVKLCFKSRQPRRGKLLTAILLALLFFLLFAFPMNIIYYNTIIILDRGPYLIEFGYMSACLNSSINPLFYFLVGRKGREQSKESLKTTFQRVFKEEEESTDELELSDGTRL